MAKIEKPKARKEYKCSKCGQTIKVGDTYLKGTPFRRSPVIRCTKCGLRSWELSSSDYVQGVGRVCDCWEEDYGCSEDTAQSIADELDTIKDNCQDSLDNMPEGLQEGDTGQLIQERIDNLDSAISDLEAIDYDTIKENAKDDVDSDEGTDEYEEELEEKIKDALRDEIESALSCLDY
jgi:DNA-directed RNA polymerase subunit RPC12/RpoP